MNIFVTSDIHGRFDALEKIIEFIKSRNDIECLVLCGDITGDYMFRYFHELEQWQYEDYKKIHSLFEKLQCKLLFIQGNHDVFNIDKDDMAYLGHNNSLEFKDFVPLQFLNFFTYGTSRESSEDEMAFRLSKLKIHSESIIISHMPPYKCLDKAKNGVNYGSKAIRDVIKTKKPKYFFCGHVHDDFGVKKLYNTMVFNSACDSNSIRGWVVNIINGKYEKVIL